MKPYRQFLILTFVTRIAFAFSFATYVMFLLSRGVTLLEVGIINMFFMIAIAIAEIPTGIFADMFGRKFSFLISNLVMAAGLFLYFRAESFWFFVIAEVVAGIGMTFRSGALEAWVVDSVAQSGDMISNERIFSSAGIVRNAANIIGGLSGAYAGNIDLAYPWLMGSIVLLIVFIAAALMIREPRRLTEAPAKSALVAVTGIIKRSIDFGLRKRIVLLLMITTLISSFFYQPLNMYWQPEFANMAGGEIWILGWIWVLISLSLMLGSYFVKLIPANWSRSRVLALLGGLNSIPIIMAAFLRSFWPILALFCTYELARGILEPVRISFINNEIPSSERATILSLDQVFMRLGAILGLVLTGLIASHLSVAISWMVAAVVGLAVIPLFLACDRSNKSSLTGPRL